MRRASDKSLLIVSIVGNIVCWPLIVAAGVYLIKTEFKLNPPLQICTYPVFVAYMIYLTAKTVALYKQYKNERPEPKRAEHTDEDEL